MPQVTTATTTSATTPPTYYTKEGHERQLQRAPPRNPPAAAASRRPLCGNNRLPILSLATDPDDYVPSPTPPPPPPPPPAGRPLPKFLSSVSPTPNGGDGRATAASSVSSSAVESGIEPISPAAADEDDARRPRADMLAEVVRTAYVEPAPAVVVAEPERARRGDVLYNYLARKRPWSNPAVLQEKWKRRWPTLTQEERREVAQETAGHLLNVGLRENMLETDLLLLDRGMMAALKARACHVDKLGELVFRALEDAEPSAEAAAETKLQQELLECERACCAWWPERPRRDQPRGRCDYAGPDRAYMVKPPMRFIFSLTPLLDGKSDKALFSRAEAREAFDAYLTMRRSIFVKEGDDEETFYVADDPLSLALGNLKAFHLSRCDWLLDQHLVPVAGEERAAIDEVD